LQHLTREDVFMASAERYERPKSAFLAVLLSFFFAGLGQIYNGEIRKGVLFILAYA